jgi:hypothetical protein
MELRVEPLRGAAELHPPQVGELGLHLLDLQPGSRQLCSRGRQLGLTLGKHGAQLGDLWRGRRRQR